MISSVPAVKGMPPRLTSVVGASHEQPYGVVAEHFVDDLSRVGQSREVLGGDRLACEHLVEFGQYSVLLAATLSVHESAAFCVHGSAGLSGDVDPVAMTGFLLGLHFDRACAAAGGGGSG